MALTKKDYTRLQRETVDLVTQESHTLRERIEDHMAEIVYDSFIDMSTRLYTDIGLNKEEYDWFEQRVLKTALKEIRHNWIRTGN
jgi:hypothetical protein